MIEMELYGDFRGLVLICKSEIDRKTNRKDRLERMSAPILAGQESLEETIGRDIFETTNSVIKNRNACS